MLDDAIRSAAPSESMARECQRSLQIQRYQFDRTITSFDEPPHGFLFLGTAYLWRTALLVGRVQGEPTAVLLDDEAHVRRLDDKTLQQLEAQLDGAVVGTWRNQGLHPICAFVLAGRATPLPVEAELEDDAPASQAYRFLETLFTLPDGDGDDG